MITRGPEAEEVKTWSIKSFKKPYADNIYLRQKYIHTVLFRENTVIISYE